MTAGPTAGDSTTPEAQAYVKEIEAVYPEIAPLASSVFVYNYYNAAEALLQGLEDVDGNIGGGQKELQNALKDIQLDAAYGQIELDDNRNGIADNYVKRIVADTNNDKTPDVQTFRQIPAVDQTFGGFFSPETPAPDRENPVCEKKDPPNWVGKAEAVDFSK